MNIKNYIEGADTEDLKDYLLDLKNRLSEADTAEKAQAIINEIDEHCKMDENASLPQPSYIFNKQTKFYRKGTTEHADWIKKVNAAISANWKREAILHGIVNDKDLCWKLAVATTLLPITTLQMVKGKKETQDEHDRRIGDTIMYALRSRKNSQGVCQFNDELAWIVGNCSDVEQSYAARLMQKLYRYADRSKHYHLQKPVGEYRYNQPISDSAYRTPELKSQYSDQRKIDEMRNAWSQFEAFTGKDGNFARCSTDGRKGFFSEEMQERSRSESFDGLLDILIMLTQSEKEKDVAIRSFSEMLAAIPKDETEVIKLVLQSINKVLRQDDANLSEMIDAEDDWGRHSSSKPHPENIEENKRQKTLNIQREKTLQAFANNSTLLKQLADFSAVVKIAGFSDSRAFVQLRSMKNDRGRALFKDFLADAALQNTQVNPSLASELVQERRSPSRIWSSGTTLMSKSAITHFNKKICKLSDQQDTQILAIKETIQAFLDELKKRYEKIATTQGYIKGVGISTQKVAALKDLYAKVTEIFRSFDNSNVNVSSVADCLNGAIESWKMAKVSELSDSHSSYPEKSNKTNFELISDQRSHLVWDKNGSNKTKELILSMSSFKQKIDAMVLVPSHKQYPQ